LPVSENQRAFATQGVAQSAHVIALGFVKVDLKKLCWLVPVLLCVFVPPVRAAGTNKNSIVPPPRRELPGRHEKLKTGELFVPDFFHAPTNGAADLVIFFFGASWCAEQNFYDARKNAVIVSINHTNLEGMFHDPEAFSNVLAETTEALKPEGVKSIGRVCVTSFSGGYVAVRAILRHAELASRISDVVLADSLYAPKVPGRTNELDPAMMAPFLKYAWRAAEGQEAHFFFSQLFPPEEKYRDNTTTLAAYYLTDHLEVERRPATGQNSARAKLLYRADKGNFHVLGYAGMSNQDHFNHFYAVSDLLRETSLEAGPRLDPSKMTIPALTWPQVKELLASNAIVLVDARNTEYFDMGRIPGAVPLPLLKFNAQIAGFEATYPRSTALVIYCTSADCVQARWEAEALIGAHGFTNVRLMPGGYEEYTRAESKPPEPAK
jgi:rhodanese-related sulfurtransferase